ncbi:MAG: phosphoribosylformylglycinamidine synthase subunit PurQ [Chitinophagales bacterium]|nr:phosphoribosylformylglycinamidine synthase subunit PurQ [Chitinophagales bacterium]
MKFGVVVFPGSNCDRDMVHVLSNVMQQKVRTIWHKDETIGDLKTEDCIVLPGGFSYGDYLRTGAIARFSPVMNAVIDFANKGGKVIGICNGFQILCESHLLPGALLKNNNQKYVCKNVFLKCVSSNHFISNSIEKDRILKIPIAHGDGRYYTDEKTLMQLKENDQIIFKYCDENGSITETSNPNGSIANIAGICNEKRNVFGMMPHPERASEKAMGNCDGELLFSSILKEFQFA